MPIDLQTRQGEALLRGGETPWTVYPRPQMKRDSYLNLNGQWEFASYGGPVVTPIHCDQKILVPFCPESQLSGIK